MNRSSPLAIVGMSCLFPKADDLQAYWANIKNGVDAITPIPAGSHWNAADYFDADPKSPDRTYARRGGFLSPLHINPMDLGISPKDIEATDTTQLLALIAAQRALIDAGYAAAAGGSGREFDRNRTSVILGVTGALELVIPLGARLGHPHWRKALREAGVDPEIAEDVVQRISDSYVGWQENSFPGLLGNVAAGRIANRLDLGGTNCVVDAACASSLAAIHLAGLELSAGLSDMVITGGVDTFNDIFMYMCFSKTPALSPTGDAKPFDRDCDGTALGEGLGVLVLKRLADAERDGDRIYAVVKGMGSSSDGRSSGIYAPRAGGQKLALQRAYAAAEVEPESIDLVEAHGTGTRVGDATEIAALTEVFRTGDRTDAWCALGSVKSQIGHTKAAAGVAGMIKAALALHEKVLPPTIKVGQPLEGAAPGHSPFYINTCKRPWLPDTRHPRRAGVSALGFGGTNFHCVLEEHDTRKTSIDWDGDVEILAFSSDSLDDLKTQLAAQQADSAWTDFRRTAHESRRRFECTANFRLLIVATAQSDRAGLKNGALKMLEKNSGRTAWTAPVGIAFGSGPVHGKIGAIFPGQGSQYAGMLRDLACQFPGMLDALAEADAVFAGDSSPIGAKHLSDFIHPHPVFSDDDRQLQEEQLKATEIAQPALGAVCMGAFNVLGHFGFAAQAACGHSYGELLALCGAGRITPDALHRLSNVRGRLMANRHGSGDRGAMLAVQADEAAVLGFLEEEKSDLVVANRNSPKQYVLAGPVEQIRLAAGSLSSRSIRSRVLQVSAAFHSALVADTRAPFAEALGGIAFGAGRMPVYSNSTGGEYPGSATEARELLANQIVRPVNFMQQIQAMHADGVRTFVEIGPGHVLTDLVQSILPGGEVEAIALDASKGTRSGIFDLALALGRLASLGHEVELSRWETAPAPIPAVSQKAAFTVAISGANYRAPSTPRPARAPATNATPVHAPLSAPAIPESVQRPAASILDPEPKNVPAALRATQEAIIALQRLQEQTAQLHRQFLEGQESARRVIQSLLNQHDGAPIRMPDAAAVAIPSAPTRVETPIPVLATQEPGLSGTRAASEPAPIAVAAARSIDRSRYAQAVLEVVSEKTGYPVEMLELGMGVESDLGIDSIKRVEIMAALRSRLPDAPEIKPEHLGSLQTLEQIVTFLAGEATASVDASIVASAAVPAAGGTLNTDIRIKEALLEVVAEKTGYPVEMLELGMGVESDLGIDSIKRVEIMAALRSRLPHSPEIKPEHLGSLQTLQQIADFLGGSADATAPASDAIAAVRTNVPAVMREPAIEAPETGNEPLRQVVRAVDLRDAGPREVIALPPGSTVWLVDDGSELSRHIEKRLHARHLSVLRRGLRANFAVAGSATPAALLILAPTRGCDDTFLKQAFGLIRQAAPALRGNGGAGTAILLTVSRLDGAFGFAAERRPADPISGGLAGLVKTAAREWPKVHCKALDLDPDFLPADQVAERIVEEMFRVGPVEVGLSAAATITLDIVPLARAALRDTQAPLQEKDVVVISGGARGVTAAAALALARDFRPTLVLLGRTSLTEDEPEWTRALGTETEIKGALFANLPRGSSPGTVENSYRLLMARREIRSQLEKLAAADAMAVYVSVDVRDADAVTGALNDIRRQHGAIRGLVHGAGVLADRRIEDKTDDQFDAVYGTKVAGMRNLLTALSEDELKVIALFSSYTGRYGRIGQADYAAANEVLNKLAQREARERPRCRIVSINWGPWNGGMVTPGLRQLFVKEGVGLIEPAAGGEFLVREIRSAAGGDVEVLAIAAAPGMQNATAPGSAGAPQGNVAFEREISVKALPCLESHVINGRAVLPAALMVEWLAQAALHGNPGMRFHGLDDFKVLKGVVLDAGESVMVSLIAGTATTRDRLHVLPVRMVSRAGGREILHARADVLLTDEKLPDAPEAEVFDLSGGEIADAYATGVLFHGAAMHGIERVEACAERGVAALIKAASAPIMWMKNPLRGTWISDPLALDSAFQMMILWSSAHRGGPSLPSALARYRQFVGAFPKGGCRAVVAVAIGISAIAVATIQFLDDQGNLLASAEGCEFVVDANLSDAFRQNRLQLET